MNNQTNTNQQAKPAAKTAPKTGIKDTRTVNGDKRDWSKDRIGALWSKNSRSGNDYMGGEIKITDKTGREEIIYIKVFANNYKDAENKPDFVIYQDARKDGQTFTPKKKAELSDENNNVGEELP